MVVPQLTPNVEVGREVVQLVAVQGQRLGHAADIRVVDVGLIWLGSVRGEAIEQVAMVPPTNVLDDLTAAPKGEQEDVQLHEEPSFLLGLCRVRNGLRVEAALGEFLGVGVDGGFGALPEHGGSRLWGAGLDGGERERDEGHTPTARQGRVLYTETRKVVPDACV